MASPSRAHRRVCIARIGAAHGVRGEVKLWPFTSDPMAVARYGVLETDDGRSIEIEEVRPGKDFLVARLIGVADRAAAEQLRNVDLFVPRERLPDADDEEYYHADLIGLSVENSCGQPMGTVTAVHNFGAGDLLEIQPVGGGMTVMVPFTADTVPVVDLARARIVVEPPEGTFEAEAPRPQEQD
jgi:16S rRNA processing protein RimM